MLVGLEDGETLQIQCYGQDPEWSIPEASLADVSFVADNYELGYKTGVMAGEWANENLGGEAEFG